jgi:hypothetical protein
LRLANSSASGNALTKSFLLLLIAVAHSTVKCNGQIVGVDEMDRRGLVISSQSLVQRQIVALIVDGIMTDRDMSPAFRPHT